MLIVSMVVFAALAWLWVLFAERDRIHRLDAEAFRRDMAEFPWRTKACRDRYGNEGGK